MPDINVLTPEEFFRSVLVDAMSRERVCVEPYTVFYVVQLLVGEIQNGHHPAEVLSEAYVRALQAKSTERKRMLRSVGDRALVFSGFWWGYEFHPRRSSSLGLYIQLGRRAYRHIGGIPFDELAQKFEHVVDVLARVATDTSLVTARDIVRLYLLWRETHSGYARRALVDRGLVPVDPGADVLS